MRIAQHRLYYTTENDAVVALVAHYGRDLGDGTHEVYVTTRSGATVAVVAAQCDPATPTAGCWSEIPA
jgi:dienelactone hydrolase